MQYTQIDPIIVLVNFFITPLFYSWVFQIGELGSAGLIRVITWNSSDSLGNQHKLVINRIIYVEASGTWKQGDNQKMCKCSLYFAFYCFHGYYFPIKTFFHLFSNPWFFLDCFHCACVVATLKDDNLMVGFSVGRKLKCTAFCLCGELLNHFPQYDTACGIIDDIKTLH